MSYVIGSDWVADWLPGRADVVNVLTSLERGGIAISIITYMEAFEGIVKAVPPRRGRRAFRAFLRGKRVLVVSRPVAERAATAIEHDLILVTGNTRDYADIPGLRLYQAKKSPDG